MKKKLDKFWQILIILTILNNFWQCWQWWTLSTIFDFWQFWHIWPMLKILDRFDIVENVRWLWKKNKKILTTFDNFCLQMLIIFAIFLSSIHDNFLFLFYSFYNLCQFRNFSTVLTILTTKTNTILLPCDIWDTDYNSDKNLN